MRQLIADAEIPVEDRKRSTRAKARVVQLLDGVTEALSSLGLDDLGDEQQLARLAALPRLVTASQRAQQIMEESPRKASALLGAGDQLAAVLAALADPSTLDRQITMTPVPILVPPRGSDGFLTSGTVDETLLPYYNVLAFPETGGSSRVELDDPAADYPQPISSVLPGAKDSYALNRRNNDVASAAWQRLGIALVTIATGYHHPDAGDLPPSLADHQYTGRRLRENLAGSTHWRIPLSTIRQWLNEAGYIQTITVAGN